MGPSGECKTGPVKPGAVFKQTTQAEKERGTGRLMKTAGAYVQG
ncbi:hypothetical protein AB434_2146 [Heyndrickxia coagulans]|uniref:Uncharacterized protein n=1 Tax=Heyndrickxia coagulans TaxID=1398 RepID=A0AAN0T6X9_HEYCO|nr:hypothetical protein SB48_HM08orf05081 [Heyndrickxia coagulans]AKN54551.1 hypothetical protein AB434_2146 [Heyndrickxia coagulans]